jgi:hypothetical protein
MEGCLAILPASFILKIMISVAIALGTLMLVLPVSGLLWFWFVRSQD